jgi:hypothetical protein
MVEVGARRSNVVGTVNALMRCRGVCDGGGVKGERTLASHVFY